MPYPSWYIHNCQLSIYPMQCIPCHTISGMPYYPIPHITCNLSYHLPHGIFIITNMPCHISHVISYMSCHILPCYFSHDLYHIIYLIFHIFCDTSLVPYMPVLFLSYCLSCAIAYAIYHVIHLWCHIYDAIYSCIASKLSYIIWSPYMLPYLQCHI
jgi:hypothetical protein